jgi:ribosomal protein S18 acetylase RimI-like enzyme
MTFCLGRKKLAAILVAFGGGRAVGFLASRDEVNLVRGSTVRHIDLIFVDIRHRHLGIGSALIRAAALSARKAGCSRLTVGAAASNEGANRFYLKLGFKAREDESTRYALTDLEALR